MVCYLVQRGYYGKGIVYYSFIVSTVEDDIFPRTTILHATINDTTTFQGCLDFIVYLFIFFQLYDYVRAIKDINLTTSVIYYVPLRCLKLMKPE